MNNHHFGFPVLTADARFLIRCHRSIDNHTSLPRIFLYWYIVIGTFIEVINRCFFSPHYLWRRNTDAIFYHFLVMGSAADTSKDHRMIWVGSDLEDHSIPALCHGQGQLHLTWSSAIPRTEDETSEIFMPQCLNKNISAFCCNYLPVFAYQWVSFCLLRAL